MATPAPFACLAPSRLKGAYQPVRASPMTEIDDLKTHLLTAIDAAAGLEALETVRVDALG